MAIEIKRTPVLEGNAAQAFLVNIQKNTASANVTADRVNNAIATSKKIMEAFKANAR